MIKNMYDDDSYFVFNRIYEQIRYSLTIHHVADGGKCSIVLGGQPGAGKSTFFKANAEYIVINGDEYRQYDPHYDEIILSDPEHLAERTQPFVNKVVNHLINDLSLSGYNLIIEGTLRNAEVAINTCRLLQSRCYSTELVVIACDAETSWQSTIKRATTEKANGLPGRLVPIDIYNYTVHHITENLRKIELANCFDHISIIDRNGTILYPNDSSHECHTILANVLNIDNWDKKYPKFQEEFLSLKISYLTKSLEKLKEIENDEFER